jgi:Tol biopolymer transport system component
VARTSADGRFVAFQTDASNVVAGDTNGALDVFVRDRKRGRTVRVSVDSAGAEANGPSIMGAISPDGRFVAFTSGATNLVPSDTNGEFDTFVHDLVTGTTERVSVDSAEQQQNGASGGVDISARGRYVAFVSAAPNLVAGDTNDQTDVFVRDRRAGVTERIGNVQGNGPAGPGVGSVGISDDGRVLAFESYATNLVPGDTNDTVDVFVHDRVPGSTQRVENGGAVLRGFSGDGQHVLFDSLAPVGVFVYDRPTGRTERVDVSPAGQPANSYAFGAAISTDGRQVAFSSEASNLVPGDGNGFLDAFVRDRCTSTTQRVSVSDSGAEGNFISSATALDGGGRLAVFESAATNLVAGDTNEAFDVFARRVVPRPKHHCKPRS